MITIRIIEFRGYTESLFLEFLRAHPLSFINIIIPKDFGSDEDPLMIVDEYWRALYTGQLLGRLSDDILHDIPDPDLPGEFSFIIATTRWEELAGLLVRLFKACDPKEEDSDAVADFMVEAATFIAAIPEDEPIYCDRFLDIIEDLLRNG
ncbi:MAG TPA: hypothetical protein VGN63_16975 [Flavisolibacter sp.]|jgi:hypothetical protein|nr:hypothetical protein [Flavisolibacter sp.]